MSRTDIQPYCRVGLRGNVTKISFYLNALTSMALKVVSHTLSVKACTDL